MKETTFIVVCAVLAFALPSRAQTTSGQPALLPPGPLINNQRPDSAQWTIDYSYTDAPKPGTDSSQLAQFKKLALQDPAVAKQLTDPHFLYSLNPARPIHVVITKSGDIRHETRDLERGMKSELWGDHAVSVERRADGPELVVSMGNAKVVNEFPEFNWISKEGFTGIEIQNGRKCLAFKQQVDPVSIRYPGKTGTGTTVLAIAYIDLQTRYPQSLQFGAETRQYTIQSPPTAQLIMPDDFAAAAKAMIDRVQKAVPHLSPP